MFSDVTGAIAAATALSGRTFAGKGEEGRAACATRTGYHRTGTASHLGCYRRFPRFSIVASCPYSIPAAAVISVEYQPLPDYLARFPEAAAALESS
jgi:hypothetical protein